MGAAVITGRDPTPVFELGEHVLDLVPLPIQRLVIGNRHLAAPGRRNAGRDVLVGKSLPEPVAVIASVGNQGCARWQRSHDEPSALMVAHLTFRQKQDDRLAGAIADGMELGVQATFRAPDTTGNIPLLSRLAAVRCAFRWVASIMIRSGLGPSPARAA